MADSYQEDVGAYDNLRNRSGGADGNRDMGPGGGGPHPGGGGSGGGPDVWEPDRKREGDEIKPGKGGTSSYSSGGYGYSSSSGGSSGSSMSVRDSRLISQAESLYYQLWGEYPPSGYAKALVKKGMNIFEIEDHERRKPAFKKTDTYQNEYMAYAKMVSQIMGTR